MARFFERFARSLRCQVGDLPVVIVSHQREARANGTGAVAIKRRYCLPRSRTLAETLHNLHIALDNGSYHVWIPSELGLQNVSCCPEGPSLKQHMLVRQGSQLSFEGIFPGGSKNLSRGNNYRGTRPQILDPSWLLKGLTPSCLGIWTL